jgi:hypothetical protein
MTTTRDEGWQPARIRAVHGNIAAREAKSEAFLPGWKSRIYRVRPALGTSRLCGGAVFQIHPEDAPDGRYVCEHEILTD